MPENQEPETEAKVSHDETGPKEPHKPEAKAGVSKIDKFKSWYLERKKWTVPASILFLALVLAAIPFTRYSIAGLVVKKNLSVKVVDSTAHVPVSGATVSLDSLTAQTNNDGIATLHHVKVGPHSLDISKKYYKAGGVKVTIPVFGNQASAMADLTAVGRQVKITVTNLINKAAIADVNIKVAEITAKTDSKGTALVVLPADSSDLPATLSANGFNDASVKVKVSSNQIQDNEFTMTPAGKIYFLSKLSGKVDVVKTNLDGTNRQTVLAGTGNEDDRNTVLLASRDWKYMALLSRRAGTNPSLYLINAADDSSTVIDSGTADFNLAGWAGDSFIYSVNHNDVQLWQNGRQEIKSYNAQTKKSQMLDQTTGTGTSNFDYLGETIGTVYAYEDQVYYDKGWSTYYGSVDSPIANKQATFNSVKPDGSSKKAIKSFGVAQGAYSSYLSLDVRIKSPDAIALHFYDGSKDNFYVYSNGQVKDDPQGSNNTFYSSNYPTYLLSPSGNNTFWSEPRDGKNTLFIGDEQGQNSQQIASLSDYNTFGWFTDDYLLVSKNSSELYIMDKAGKQTPVKISDYHKPAVSFQGYGGGYGGL